MMKNPSKIKTIYKHYINTNEDAKMDSRYLLDNPEEAVVVVPVEPKLKADDGVVLEPNEPKENPDVS